jgi:hypothetical protein
MSTLQLNQNPISLGSPPIIPQLQSPNIINGDPIDTLPIDQLPPSHEDIKLTDILFKKNKKIIDIILADAKNVLLMGILFIIFSLPIVDDIICRYINIANNSIYILIVIKAIFFMIIYYLINNLYLARLK